MQFFKNLNFITILLILTSAVYARPKRVGQIPNGSENTCANCHINPAGGGARNAFGVLIEKQFLTEPGPAGDVMWGPLLSSYDADGDGVSNGLELQDEFGQWVTGQPAPGDQSLVTLPGIDSSSATSTLTVQFSNMGPHVGETLYLRVVDKATMKETGRTMFTPIAVNFDVTIDAILTGRSYYIDFFADHNSNGLYNPPPTDHAWRIELNNAAGSDIVQFAHNTNFIDINWPYEATINFTGMTPHLSEMMEIRIEDDQTSAEVARYRIETIPSADFTVKIPGLEFGRQYNLEFYADHNANGLYNAPPTDHAWRESFNSSSGDAIINFAHNTNFTDINWKYFVKVNLLGMVPHVGQLFELRVVDQNTQAEIGRKSVSAIPLPDFSIEIPETEIGHDYNIDFYADLNGNGQYNPPPTDHAWRITFTANGDAVQNFTHNTNFTDIQWPGTTGIDDNSITGIPSDYSLSQNYPNPFNPSTKISFNLLDEGLVKLKVFDILGNEIATLVDNFMAAGSYSVNFNAANLNSGVYFYRIESNNFTQIKKMMLLK